MYTNMIAQLKEADALSRLPEVYAELPRTRRDLGYPPLVTPTSQIIGSQAVSNVLFGRYKVVSEQVKSYVYGLYGQPPAAVDPEVQKIVLSGYERGEEPITVRPADTLQPELESARAEAGALAGDIGDLLTYVLYPTSGMRFLRWKHGLEAAPPETRGKTLEDIQTEDELLARVRSGELVSQPVPQPAPQVQTGGTAPSGEVSGTPLLSPMPGTIIRYLVGVGDEVSAGDGVCVLEAMKMENVLPAPEDGRIVAISCQPGDKVQLNQTLAVIG
jgi:pyruvate carboxylase subunit B